MRSNTTDSSVYSSLDLFFKTCLNYTHLWRWTSCTYIWTIRFLLRFSSVPYCYHLKWIKLCPIMHKFEIFSLKSHIRNRKIRYFFLFYSRCCVVFFVSLFSCFSLFQQFFMQRFVIRCRTINVYMHDTCCGCFCVTQLGFCLFIYLSPMLNAPYLSQHHT